MAPSFLISDKIWSTFVNIAPYPRENPRLRSHLGAAHRAGNIGSETWRNITLIRYISWFFISFFLFSSLKSCLLFLLSEHFQEKKVIWNLCEVFCEDFFLITSIFINIIFVYFDRNHPSIYFTTLFLFVCVQ